jgi:hypothetical protein
MLWTESTVVGPWVYRSSLLNQPNRYADMAVPPAERRWWPAGLGPRKWYMALLSTRFGPMAPGRTRFAYLGVAVVGVGGRRRWPFFLKLGWRRGGSPVYLWRWENTNGGGGLQRSFLGGWLGADGSTTVWAQFGWGKPLRTSPYIGKLVATSHEQCRLQSYAIFVLI